MSVENPEHLNSEAGPEPFAGEPQDPAAFQGCSRPALLGCGAAVLITAVLFLLLIVYARDLFEWSFRQSSQQILESLPADVTPAEEERLRRALDGVSRAVTEGEVDIRGLQEFLDAFSLATQKGEGMTREDVLEATRALEAVAGIEPPEDVSLRPVAPERRGPPALAVL
jgi:hypothetical protein